MANEDFDLEPEVELLGEAEDNARSLTSGLVITTFVLGLLALFAIIKAQGAYGLGPFKG